jgi:peptidoglycan/xylan/chitin deacetylase (PgdA/CDA1 family)
MTQKTELLPWQWPDEYWKNLINHLRGGKTYKPKKWPGNARCAVAFSFDSDHETNELRDGGKSYGRLQWGQYGNRVGVPKVLEFLAKEGIQATFYVPAVVALTYPDEQRRVIAEGHEIGVHGWIHEVNSTLPYEHERSLMLRAADTLEKITKVRPAGLRTPSWDFSADTLRIEQEIGVFYDSSLMGDVDCYELMLDGKDSGIVELPVEWIRDDAAYLLMQRFGSLRPWLAPSDIFDIFRREFDGAYAEGGIFQLTMHPHVIGYRSRFWILEELVKHIKSHKDVWFATHKDVAMYARQNG